MIKKFSREYLTRTLFLPYDEDSDLVKVHLNDLYSKGRWTSTYRLVFEILETNECFEVFYEEGNTEQQWCQAWENQDMVSCTKVKAVIKPVAVWEPVC